MRLRSEVVDAVIDSIRDTNDYVMMLLRALERGDDWTIQAHAFLEMDSDLRSLIENLKQLQPYIQKAYQQEE